MSNDIFVSYGSADRDVARSLAARLEESGRSVWWDREIAPGENFERAIENAIDDSRCVVVLWSSSSVVSDWVHAEALDGHDRKILIPVIIENIRVPLAFRALNAVDLSGWPETHDPHELDRLLERISVLLGDARRPPDVQVREPSSSFKTERMETEKSQLPSVAVLPLMTPSGNPDDEMLSAGVTSEVINSLSRLPGFFVIAFSSMWSYRGRDADARQVAHELGVRYVVQGTALKIGDQIQVMAELVDATSYNQLWSESFQAAHTVEDVFSVQNDISTAIAGRLQPRLMVAETARSRNRPPETLQAWELVNRARQPYAGRDKAGDIRRLLYRAIEIDPNYGEAYALLAMLLSFRVSILGPQYAVAAREAIDRAIEVDPDHDLTLMATGVSCVNLGHYDEAIFYCKRAVEMNPNFAQAWAYYGLSVLGAEKDGASAIEKIDRAFELSPSDEYVYLWYHLKAPCYTEMGDYENASEMSGRSISYYRGWFFSWLCHAQHLALAGRGEEARAAWVEARRRFSGLTMDVYRRSVRSYSPMSSARNEAMIEAMEGIGIE